jgi:hypothetical protein
MAASYITFKINNYDIKFILSIKWLQEIHNNNNNMNNMNIQLIIKNNLEKYKIIVNELNIKLYDIDNNVNINDINDLLKLNTQRCLIIIKPIVCNEHV